jgi:hypothetical protein
VESCRLSRLVASLRLQLAALMSVSHSTAMTLATFFVISRLGQGSVVGYCAGCEIPLTGWISSDSL